jgi:hypothetical protein
MRPRASRRATPSRGRPRRQGARSPRSSSCPCRRTLGTAGLELAKRAARSNRGTPTGDALERLVAEIDADRATLQRLLAMLGKRPSKTKDALAWSAERLGRLKLHGQLRGYSPLSRLDELEALSLGVAAKRALWEALRGLPEFTFAGLRRRGPRTAGGAAAARAGHPPAGRSGAGAPHVAGRAERHRARVLALWRLPAGFRSARSGRVCPSRLFNATAGTTLAGDLSGVFLAAFFHLAFPLLSLLGRRTRRRGIGFYVAVPCLVTLRLRCPFVHVRSSDPHS